MGGGSSAIRQFVRSPSNFSVSETTDHCDPRVSCPPLLDYRALCKMLRRKWSLYADVSTIFLFFFLTGTEEEYLFDSWFINFSTIKIIEYVFIREEQRFTKIWKFT